MITATQTDIIGDIRAYMDKRGGPSRSWYVGVSSDPRKRLFQEHGVEEVGGSWIIREATSSTIARAIERYFIDTLGTDGGPGGGDHSCRYVYAYKKASGTRP